VTRSEHDLISQMTRDLAVSVREASMIINAVELKYACIGLRAYDARGCFIGTSQADFDANGTIQRVQVYPASAPLAPVLN